MIPAKFLKKPNSHLRLCWIKILLIVTLVVGAIPTFGENWSLNLAQAVLLALYTLRTSWGGAKTVLDGQKRTKKESQEEVFPENTLKTWINEMGFVTEDRNMNAYSVLKRMLLHNIPTQKELRILETVLQQAIRKLREYNEMRKKS